MTRSRPSPSKHAAASNDARPDDAADTATLQFSETLTWRAGKPIPVAELLRRLKMLSSELREMEQEQVDRGSLAPPAKELAGSNILTHKDRGVRALAACCLVDALRLCAPEAPFTASQLKDIFTLFISHVIPALSDPSNPYHTQHLYVLQSLAQVKSIVLLVDVPSPSDLIRRLFSTCFDVLAAAGENASKSIQYNMTSVLESVVDECPSLPADVVDTILAQFLRGDQQSVSNSSKAKGLASKQDDQSTIFSLLPQPSYTMAKNVCNTCSDRMSRYVSQYFSGVIMDASAFDEAHRGLGSSDGDTQLQSVTAEDDLKELRKAHRLLKELWRCSPALLQNVIPQIEAELQANHPDLRLLAVEAIGDLVANVSPASSTRPSQQDDPTSWPPLPLPTMSENTTADQGGSASSHQPFPLQHSAAYRSFVSRRNDKSAAIRAAWTASIGKILSTSSEVVGVNAVEESELLDYFSNMLLDTDEKVRIAAISAIGQFSLSDVVYKLGAKGPMHQDDSMLHRLAERVKDKRALVRAEAMPLMARLWSAAAGEIASGNQVVKDALGLVPTKILDAYYTNDPETLTLIDKVMFEFLMPVGFPRFKTKHASGANEKSGTAENQTMLTQEQNADRVRVERLLLLSGTLDTRSKAVFSALLSRSAKYVKFMEALVKRLEDFNGGVMDSNSEEITSHMKKLIGMFSKMYPDQLRAADDIQKFAKLHDRRCYSLIKFCIAWDSDYDKIRKSLRELRKRLEASIGQGSVPDTILMLVQRCAHLFFNRSHVVPIITISQERDHQYADAAHEMLKEISTNAPAVLDTHAGELCRLIDDSPVDAGSLDTLKACALFAKRMPKSIPQDRKFTQKLMQYALVGRPPNSAKYAVSIVMATVQKKDMHAKNLLRQCTENFQYGSEGYLTKLACLSQLMLLASKSLDDDDCDRVTAIAISQVLQRPSTDSSDTEDPEWTDNPDDECQAKLWALRILVNRLRAYDDPASITSLAEPVYALLNKLIAKNGELSKGSASPKAHCSALRLEAALLLLKLSCKPKFDSLLTPVAFNKLAEVVQDPLFVVRKRFLEKAMKYLVSGQLSSRFNVLIFMTAFEPSDRLRTECSTWISARSRSFAQQKKGTMETSVARFLSLLAHHPDFDIDVMEDFVTYIMYYIRMVMTEDNISLIHHVVQRVKAVQDGIDVQKSENLYCLSDLAQLVIRVYADIKDWTLQAYEGRVNLPYGIFQPMPGHETAQAVSEKNYVPATIRGEVEALVRANLKPPSKKRRSDGDGGRSRGAKRRATTSSAAGSVARNKANKRMKQTRDIAKTENVEGERRKSSRTSGIRPSYAEDDDTSEDGTVDDNSFTVVRARGHQENEDEEQEESGAEEQVRQEEDKGTESQDEDKQRDAAETRMPFDDDMIDNDEHAGGSEKENHGRPAKRASKRQARRRRR